MANLVTSPRPAGLVLALGGLLALGCADGGAKAPSPPATPERPLVIATAADFSGPNELLSSSQLDHEIRSNLFLNLLQEQPDYQESPPTFAPRLAERYRWSDDHLELTFELRPDVVWSDGVPVTAHDVRWTWQAQTSPEVGWVYSFVKDSIRDVEVVDDHTVVFRFDRAYPNQLLDANEGYILPRHAWSELPFAQWPGRADWFQEHLVVSGPFTVTAWKPQQETVLSANPRYHRKDRPRLARVVFRVLPDETSRWRQFLSGEVDMIRTVPADRVEQVESDPELEVIAIDSRQYNFIAWNGLRPLFRDAEMRRAMTLAIDRQELVDTLYHGRAQVGSTPLPGSVWARDRDLAPWPYDPDEAARRLTAIGWVDQDGDGIRERDGEPLSFELSTNTGNQLRRDALLLIQEQLRRVGVDARPTFLEIQALITSNDSHEFDATLGAWAIDTSLDLRYAFHSDEIDGGANYGGFSNHEADRLMDEIAEAREIEDAKPLFDRLQEILHEEQPYTFLWEPPNLLGMNRRIENANPNALSMLFDLEDWTLSR